MIFQTVFLSMGALPVVGIIFVGAIHESPVRLRCFWDLIVMDGFRCGGDSRIARTVPMMTLLFMIIAWTWLGMMIRSSNETFGLCVGIFNHRYRVIFPDSFNAKWH